VNADADRSAGNRDRSEPAEDVAAVMRAIGRAASAAAGTLALATTAAKNRALTQAAHAVRQRQAEILAANAEDVSAARNAGLSAALLDRLLLDAARVAAIADGLDEVARLDDPVGAVIAGWMRPNGLRFERVRVPLGVIGIVYESRPNVTADAGALCLSPAMLRSCGAVVRASARVARFTRAWSKVCAPRNCPKPPSSSCRRPIVRRSV
jgi:glutamate-5-semialdehyde dehydrogenase